MRIAYLDDDDEYAALLMTMLTRLGHQVSLFHKTAPLMTALEMEPPAIDAFITDYHMPDGNGGSVVARILEKFPGLPCAIISTDDLVAKRAIAGAIVCEKPYDLQAFKDLVARIFSSVTPTAKP